MTKWYGADDREAKRAKGTAKSEDGFFIETAAKVAKEQSAPRLNVASAHENKVRTNILYTINEHAHEYTYLYTKTMYARKYTTYIHNIGL